jgi:hypothetical protein
MTRKWYRALSVAAIAGVLSEIPQASGELAAEMPASPATVLSAEAPGGPATALPPAFALLVGLSEFGGALPSLGEGAMVHDERALSVPRRLRKLARVLVEKQGFERVWIVSDVDLTEEDESLRRELADKIQILTPDHRSGTESAGPDAMVIPPIEVCDVNGKAALRGQSVARQIREFLIRKGNLPRSRIVLYYAGHGEVDGGEGFLAGGCLDEQGLGREGFRLESIQTRELASWVRLAKAEQVLTIVDSCFAGSVFVEPSGIRTDIPVAAALRYPVRQFIVAGGLELTRADGTFTSMLIDVLEGKRPEANANADEYLSGTEIGAYLRAHVPAELERKGDFTPATPRYGELPDPSLNRGVFAFSPLVSGGAKRTALEFGDRIGLVRDIPFRDCATCPWMLLIPPPPLNAPSGRRSCPSSSYAIGQQEITVAEWKQCEPCLEAWKRAAGEGAKNLPATGAENLPVVAVTAEEADLYAQWLSDRTGHVYGLPTDEQWRCAAGSLADATRISMTVNCRGCAGRSVAALLPAGSVPANEFGLYDMLGNAWEWTRSEGDRSQRIRCASEPRQSVRGGSFSNGPDEAVVGDRGRPIPCDTRSSAVGFRVVRVQ